jgi:hypothetical protein
MDIILPDQDAEAHIFNFELEKRKRGEKRYATHQLDCAPVFSPEIPYIPVYTISLLDKFKIRRE